MRKYILTIILVIICSITMAAKDSNKGYRGFVGLDTEFYFDTNYIYSPTGPVSKKTESYWLYGVSTTHGYQFNKHFFLGGGIELQFGAGEAGNAISEVLFVSVRTDWTFGKVPLYADIRLGGTLFGRDINNEVDKLLIAPTIGYRHELSKKIKFNVGIGLSLHGCDGGYHASSHYTWKPFPTIRLGIEF
ncbi:MAG: hypothetical protein NC453_09435 [Muribaculum sp.]|nr:hypothetical protein [Muribaculum sp.]